VDLYGVPRYQELNPAIFTCMTFPFFFGIMFGDIGHGLCLLIIGIYLINNSNRFPTWKPYRYMITLMGAFSFYIGFVYNEFFGLQLNLFGSCYVEENKSLASFANSDIRK
jgi:V-type H+-transporting ATPase subunit a